MGLVLNAFLSGAISTTCMIQIPIRSQAAVGLSALEAGVYLLPYTLTMELGAMLAAPPIRRRRLPPVYSALAAAVMQLVGVALPSTVPCRSGIKRHVRDRNDRWPQGWSGHRPDDADDVACDGEERPL